MHKWLASLASCCVAVSIAAEQTMAFDISTAAAHIDQLVAAGLAEHKLAPNPDCPQETFVRRIYLDIVGRIPTAAEAIAARDEKRGALIHQLLDGEGYVSNQFNWWADLLRVESSMQNRFPGLPYIDWIKTAIRANKHYDDFVIELLTSEGHPMERGRGATGYYVRDAGMPQDNMSNTVQVFLGTRLACAQCHNHPFDTWTRLDYMHMAAFTNGTNASPNKDFVKAFRQARTGKGAPTQEEKQAFRRLAETLGMEVTNNDKATIQLPKDYQYDDGKPNQVVQADTMFGDDVAIKKGEDPRVAYAAWMTSPKNPRFTTVIANRMWKKALGIGLVEPVDNFTAETVASNPALLEYLTSLMVDVDYDLKLFQEIVFNTKTYQRAATTQTPALGEPYYFQGPLLRRMKAEQVWDSLLTLVVPQLDERKLQDPEEMYDYYDEMKTKTVAELIALVKDFSAQIAQRKELAAKIKALNEASDNKQDLRKSKELRDLRMQQRELNESMQAVGYRGGKRKQKAPETDPRWAGFQRELVRASELPSPAPPGHLLRDFGQSDRALIENGNDHPAVTQALFLLNGAVDKEVLQSRSVIMQQVAAQKTERDKIRMTFLSVLGREQTAKERPLQAIAGQWDKAALDDLVWSLINSHEFLFIQ